MKRPLVGIVVLNWNRLDLTKTCIQSILDQEYLNYKIIVVDNGSKDGSVDYLKSHADIIKIFNQKNRGYAPAINQGFAKAIDEDCSYIVALNNDARITKNWLNILVQYMENHSDTAFAQGASMQDGDHKLFDSSGIYLEKGFIPNQRAIGSESPRLDIPVIGPNAAGAIYRKQMLEDIAIKPGQYFDNTFFAYVEDVDLNLRCTLRGYKFAYINEATLYHIGSATGNKVARKKMFWGARNLVWLIYKNAPLAVLKPTFKLIVKSHLANLQFLFREQRKNFLPYLAGLFVGIVCLPFFFRKRLNNLHAQKLTNNEFLDLLVDSNPPLDNPLRKLLDLIR